MFASNSRHLAAASLLCLVSVLAAPAGAQIIVGGDAGEIWPANPSTWTTNTNGQIGINAGKTAIVTVTGSSHMLSSVCVFGNQAGSSGTVTLTGPNATWTSAGLVIGSAGAGTLIVQGRAKVTSFAQSAIGFEALSTGSVTVAGMGSRWTNDFLLIGYHGTGTLIVSGGGEVTTNNAASVNNGSTASITGTATRWITGSLGVNDRGTMTVSSGAQVTTSGSASVNSGVSGRTAITGTNASWTCGDLDIGSNNPSSTLTAGNGGKVTALSVNIASTSDVRLHVSGDGMLVVGTSTTAGSIVNSGKVNLYADTFVAAKTYLPITELQGRTITWSGTGSYNAYGGVWDSTAHTFTVAAAATSGSGAPNTLTTGERLLITDSATGKRVGASFGTVSGGTNFSAAVLSGADLIGLPADQTVLGAWNFTTNFSGDQALLSFDIGAGQAGDLSVWHYDGTAWTPFAAPDLTYGDDGIANFAVTGFSGYAITAAVPEPCSLAMLVMGGMALVRRRGR